MLVSGAVIAAVSADARAGAAGQKKCWREKSRQHFYVLYRSTA